MYTILKFNSREEWLKARKDYITATDAYNILTGRMAKSGAIHMNDYLRWGSEREEQLAKDIINTFADKDIFCNLYHSDNELYVKENTNYACSPDVIGDNAVIEIKTTTKDIPMDLDEVRKKFPQYFYQVQWQLFVTGRKVGILFFEKYEFTEDKSVNILETHSIHIKPDNEAINGVLNALEFDPSTDTQTLGDQLYNINQQIKELTKTQDELKSKLTAKLAEENLLYVDTDRYKISVIKGGVSKVFDSTRFKKDNPSVYETYTKEVKKSDSLRIVGK